MKIIFFTLLLLFIFKMEIIKSTSISSESESDSICNKDFSFSTSTSKPNWNSDILAEIKSLKNCAKDIYPILKHIYKTYKEYRSGNKEGKENAKKLLIGIGNESINLGMDCYKIIESILIKFDYI